MEYDKYAYPFMVLQINEVVKRKRLKTVKICDN